MELLQLTYFCDAARTQNFSQTARYYQVPASNISQSVKRLEEELGAPLFDRRGNRVSLNPRGEAFAPEVSWRGQFSDRVVLHSMGDYTRQVGIYCRRGGAVPGHVDAFCTLLVEYYEREQKS